MRRSKDELCLICGVSPNPYVNTVKVKAEDLFNKIVQYDPSLLADMDLERPELEELLQKALYSSNRTDDLLVAFVRPGWKWRSCVAIGHFLQDGDTPHRIVKSASRYIRRIPDGKDVEIRVVRDSSSGNFHVVINRMMDGENNLDETEESTYSRTATNDSEVYPRLSKGDGFGNFFLSEGCFHYLQTWIDYSRLPEPSHGRQLSFVGELYEVINSRNRGRVTNIGIVPWIDYDGIEQTLHGAQGILGADLKIPRYTTASIRNNDSLEAIHTSIIRDCRCWMFFPPDIWPSSANNLVRSYTFSRFPMTKIASNRLTLLPNEILSHILQLTNNLRTYFSMASTSKWLYNTLTDPSFLNNIIREMASSPSRCLFWVHPVASMQGEVEKSYKMASTFIPPPESQSSEGIWKQEINSASPFAHRKFPWYNFVRACYESDSMMNRKRIWGQVKQLEEVWRVYRIYGWEVDRFGVPLRF